jgi:hypothetical protein
VVLPTFVATGIPNSFQNYNDEESMSYTPPKAPENLETMTEGEREEALERFRRRHVHFFYMGFTQRFNERHWQALVQDSSLLKRRLYTDAGNPWEGINTRLQMDLVLVMQNWAKLATPNPDGSEPQAPYDVDDEEIERITKLSESLDEDNDGMEMVKQVVGIDTDGWTPDERFEESRTRAGLLKEGLLADMEDLWLRQRTEEHWPFENHEEED